MNENTNPIHRVAFGKVILADDKLEALRAEAIRREDGQHTPELVDDVLKSPVVLRSEYDSLRQEFIETMQYLANHSQMTENLKDYCNKTLVLLEENDDRIT